MSKSGGVGVGVRVSSSIPKNVRTTIVNIKEIASNHSDDDIYSMLKECSMDPNETTQRLLFLDSFHEVKSKRYKRKENMNSRAVGECRGKPSYQYQWRSDSGNAAVRIESRDKGFRPMNGPIKVPNGVHEPHSSLLAHSNKSPLLPNPASHPSSSPASHIHQISSQSNHPIPIPIPIPIDRGKATSEPKSCSHLNKHQPHILNESHTSLPMTQKLPSPRSNVAQCSPPEKVHPPPSVSVFSSCSPQGVEEAASKIDKLKFSDGQHVLIPSHIQVPDAVKNMLSFGSFGVGEKHSNSESNSESNSAAAKVHDETTSKSSSCEEDGKLVDQPHSPVHLLQGNAPVEPEVSSSATVPKGDEVKEDHLLAVGPPFPVVQAAPSYSFGLTPPLLVDPLVKPEMFESQAHVSNSQVGGSPPMTTSPSTPPPVQSAGVGQNSVAPSPLSITLFRQSYPHNCVHYSHYYPFFPAPAMHPYFGHTAFPMLPPGNMYLPPPGVAAGMKVSPAPYKPGANTGNQGPVGLPSGYGAYNSAQASFSPTASLTSGNSIVSEDTVPSLLKENNTYLGQGQQSEGSTMWVPSAGRDAASFPLNAYMNLTSPVQHLINSQSGPSAFVYHALQSPMTTPAAGLTLLQQSQPMTGSVESVGSHPPNVHQQVNSNI